MLGRRYKPRQRAGGVNNYTACVECKIECMRLTTTRRPSHSAVLKAWSFAGGFPGRTARIEAVVIGGRLRLGNWEHHCWDRRDVSGELERRIFKERIKDPGNRGGENK